MSGRLLILFEIASFTALAVGSKALLDPIAWRFSGPISLVLTIAILTAYLHARGQSWREYGLVSLKGIKAKLMILPKAALTLMAFVAAVAPIVLLGPMLGFTFLEEIPAGVEDRWGDVEGNLKLYLLWLAIVWTAAAFGEEMFFRGFLITKIDALFKGTWIAPVLAVFLSAALFGLAHMYYQGLRGLVVTGMIGIAFGTMFILLKRNLWPMVLVHGFVDTLTFTSTYLGTE
jgi:membrane protease YdiL (CAAX protease family)